MMTSHRRMLLVAGFALAASCGGETKPEAHPGDLVAAYSQSGPTPGAFLLTITGGIVTTVTAVNPAQVQVASYAAVPGTTKVIVTGTFQPGDMLRIRVPDLDVATGFQVKIDQVADNLNFALIDGGPYFFTVHK